MRSGFPLLVTLMLIVPVYGVVPIPYVQEDQIELDGQLADWSELLGPPLLSAPDFLLVGQQGLHQKALYVEYDPDNLDFHLWLGWSRQGRIFVAAEFSDDLIRDDFSALFKLSDGLSVYVKPDHRFVHEQGYVVRPGLANILLPKPYSSPDFVWTTVEPFGGSGRVDQDPPGSQRDPLSVPDSRWSVEFFVTVFDELSAEGPDESVVAELTAGDLVNLSLFVHDVDVPENLQALFYLSDTVVLLLSLDETAVRQQRWGEIKATVSE